MTPFPKGDPVLGRIAGAWGLSPLAVTLCCSVPQGAEESREAGLPGRWGLAGGVGSELLLMFLGFLMAQLKNACNAREFGF